MASSAASGRSSCVGSGDMIAENVAVATGFAGRSWGETEGSTAGSAMEVVPHSVWAGPRFEAKLALRAVLVGGRERKECVYPQI